MMERHVLVVLPHPDDESFGVGGTIALHRRNGTPVTCVIATLGQMGRNMGKPFFATRETLGRLREKELVDACAALGVEDLRLLRLRDKTLEFEDPERLADLIETVVGEVNPSLVITHYPGHGVHPDHDALALATVLAVGRRPTAHRPVVQCHAITRNREEVLGPPDVVNDISAVMEIKLAALRAHRSQTEAIFKRVEAERESNPDAEQQFRQMWSTERLWVYRFPSGSGSPHS